MSDEQLTRIESKIDAFETKFDSIDAKFKGIDSTFDQLGAEMRALHEATKDDIKLVADNVVTLRGEMNHGLAAVRKELADGLAPLSDAVRHHTAVLNEIRQEGVSRREP
jgi:hypothetical protein